MKPAKLAKRVTSRLRSLLRRLRTVLRRCRHQGEVGTVHELRTTLRRLRLKAALVAPWLGRGVADEFHAWARRTSRRTSMVRDLDVTIGWLRRHRGPAAVVIAVQRLREARWHGVQRWLAVPAGGLPDLKHERLPKGHHLRLVRRYEERFARMAGRVEAMAVRFDRLSAAERHAFRRQVRRLRYLRELALPRRKHPGDPLIKSLATVQIEIGGELDRTVAAQWARKLAGTHLATPAAHARQTRRRVAAALRRLVRHLQNQAGS